MATKLTLQDVARKVGVSVSTISRVLSGASGVNEGTRRKVLNAVRELNYVPGVVAHHSGSSRLIGLLMPAAAEPWGVRTHFTEEGLKAINDVAAASNYAAMAGSFNPVPGAKVEDEMIRRGDFAGVLLFRTRDELGDSEIFRRQGIPFLVVNRLLPDTPLNYIGPDHLHAGVLATEHLLACGHRRIGLLLGSERYVSHRLYLQGFHKLMSASDGVTEHVSEIELTPEDGYRATRAMMQTAKPPDALIVTGDRASLGCLKALRDLKKKVPRDVAVVSIDGTSETAFADPPLTAVEFPWYDMLALGTRLLMDLIRHRPPIVQIGVRLSSQLVVRESTQAVRKEKRK